MSSSESLIDVIEKNYGKTRKVIQASLQKATAAHGAWQNGDTRWIEMSLSRSEGLEVFKEIMRFQRFLESSERSLKIFDGLPYYERATAEFADVLNLVRSEKVLPQVVGAAEGFTKKQGNLSVIVARKGMYTVPKMDLLE